ncbi:hypothetical protein MGYG_04291 [Nannizzia gypsea CBS 118893]|uniref:Uncharacterized protein n=1 Tax=Arthroderma gypseum (strain ATCC MYA-4604 / CBS 118893) TaxID=535722 RepID=E4US82_ARTGP|nr:hypothetical protein MGYG_04291 [Nannizzia gypsea CBS 118893]EFR01286.1 hypothetical protein MGYG_04291 [Nannizzia gypsea CBS 118893]
MKLPLSFTTNHQPLQPRQYVAPAPAPACNCLSGGAIAGIVLGSIAAFLFLWWLIRCAFLSTRVSRREPTVATTTYYNRPGRSRSHSGSYYSHSHGGSRSGSRGRRGSASYYGGGGRYVERPSKVYL